MIDEVVKEEIFKKIKNFVDAVLEKKINTIIVNLWPWPNISDVDMVNNLIDAVREYEDKYNNKILPLSKSTEIHIDKFECKNSNNICYDVECFLWQKWNESEGRSDLMIHAEVELKENDVILRVKGIWVP